MTRTRRDTRLIKSKHVAVERRAVAASPAAASRFEVVLQPGGPIRPIAREVERMLVGGRFPRILYSEVI